MTSAVDGPKYMQDKPFKFKWTVDARFRVILKILRTEFSPNRPVKIRRIKWKDDPSMVKMGANGYCHLANSTKAFNDQYFLIVIRSDMSWDKQCDAIMHEWAHALTWDVPSRQDHHRSWAREYGKIYRRIIED